MRIDMWTLGLQAINLIVLVWILSRYLFKPIGAISISISVEKPHL